MKTENSLNLVVLLEIMLFCEKEVNKLLIENKENASTIGKDKLALNKLED
jgi:hypothetical protein